MRLQRNANMLHQAGIEEEAYWDFPIGSRVMTTDGIAGTVTEVHDGPMAGSESYEVVLDNDLGGGEYRSSDLSVLEETSRTAQMADPSARVASDDYPELAEILMDRPPLAHAQRLSSLNAGHIGIGSMSADRVTASDDEDVNFTDEGADEDSEDEADLPFFSEAGLWDHIFAPVVERATRHIDKNVPDQGESGMNTWSHDWCRFRSRRTCFYPKEMDVEATQLAGYAVWIPVDRGICGRDSWSEQKQCQVAEPGPKSGEPNASIDATVSWRDGGQRDGMPTYGSKDVASTFEFTAAWKDVRKKASDIRGSGGVRVLSILGDKDSGRVVTAEVRGANGVYQTSVSYEPGKYAVGHWECACPWSAYSWGRSGRWKKYEGRMCSHALALSYEAQSQYMQETPGKPSWSKNVIQFGDYVPPPMKSAMKVASTDPSLQDAPVRAMASAGKFLDFGGDLMVRYRGDMKFIRGVMPTSGEVTFTDGSSADVSEVSYPTYDPSVGLVAELKDAPESALPITTAEDEVESDDSVEDMQASGKLDWLKGPGGGPSDDVAMHARAFLDKTAVKVFSPKEQAEIIEEGEDEVAGNLDLLQIQDTHYAALDSALGDDESEDNWLA